MPRSVHTEPCSPGICGQQERLVPVTGKDDLHASIIGQRVARQSLSGTNLSDTRGSPLPTNSDCDVPLTTNRLTLILIC